MDVSFGQILHELAAWAGMESRSADANIHSVIIDIRLPRILLAALAGGGLSLAGVVFQALLRNVLAEPYILGVSGGASVGALVAITTGIGAGFFAAIPLFAFAGGACVVLLVYFLGARLRMGDSNSLLLSGVMVGAFCSAAILGLITMVGDPLRNAMFWLLGYLGNATMDAVLIVAPVVLLLALGLFLVAHSINAISLGQEQASHLGVQVKALSTLLYAAASLLSAIVVSFAGTIGFVGLIVPHACRRLFGSDHRVLLPSAFFSGAMFLVFSDLLARTLFFPMELPVGAVTAAIGAPLFISLLRAKG
jgi:iron complex transport system permease protein